MISLQTYWILIQTFNVYFLQLCFSANTFLEPKILSPYQESYILNDLEYIFTNKRVSWEEADIGCSALESGSLAIVDNREKEQFLSLALSESDLVLEDLWIGATLVPRPDICNEDHKYINNGGMYIKCQGKFCFEWTTGDVVNANIRLSRFKEENVDIRECLSFARNYHQDPSFIDLNCKLKRPYMCQKPADEEDGHMTHKGWIRIGEYEYAIFYAKKTWKESVRECFTKHKAHLADFREMNEIAGIGKYLLIGRPSLENAWIGAHYKFGQWRYISIDDIIPDTKTPNTLYPPWPNPNETTMTNDGCLLLDRHLDDGKKLIFLPGRCHRKKSYICSRRVSGGNTPPFEVIIINDICYTLYYSEVTWSEAVRTCISQQAWLVEVTPEKLDHVLYIMGENRTEINHIWIGGKLMLDNTWYWIRSNDTIESDSNKIFHGYPPWLDNIFDQKYACLNMDRENHNRPIFYGVFCEEKQPFICQQIHNCPITTTTSKTTAASRDRWKWYWPSTTINYSYFRPFNEIINKNP